MTIHGPSVVAKSLPFAGPRRTFISRAWTSRADQSLKIVYPKMWPAASPGDRSRPSEPDDAADHGADLELEVEPLGARRAHLGAGRDDRVRVREVEGRELVPLVDHVAGAVDRGGDALDVLLERHEVAHARGHERGEQLDLGERYGCRGVRPPPRARAPRRDLRRARRRRSGRAGTARRRRPTTKPSPTRAVVSPARDPHATTRPPVAAKRRNSSAAFPDRIARSSAAASPASRTRSTGSSTPMSNG